MHRSFSWHSLTIRSKLSPRVAFWPLLACIAGLICACGGGGSGSHRDESNPSFNFTPITQSDIDHILEVWTQRDLSSKDAEKVFQDDTPEIYRVSIYKHTVQGRTHYGAVIVPKSKAADTESSRYPVVLFADGLDQGNPTINVESVLSSRDIRFSGFLDRMVLLIPAFRGRTLIYKGRTFAAEGDFCDAYDGATDDSIALLNVAEQLVPEGDFSQVMVRGGSRGGNVALLLGERESRIQIVDATSAPVDFYRTDVMNQYSRQYSCQFLDGKTLEQSRERILASSPLHFPMQRSVERVYLFHGGSDSVVPPWNPEQMNAHLVSTGTTVDYHVYPGFGHGDVYVSGDYASASNQALAQFIAQ